MPDALLYLDYIFQFLFINSKGKALIDSVHLMKRGKNRPYTLGNFDPPVEAEKAKSIYELQIRRYFGLGFLFSFIPGTEAFTARTEYFSSLRTLHLYIDYGVSRSDHRFLHYLRLTPLYFLDNFIWKIYAIPFIDDVRHPERRTFHEASYELPILSDLLQSQKENRQEKWYKYLVHTLVNPIRILSSLLRFYILAWMLLSI
jgi:hypothetical protein